MSELAHKILLIEDSPSDEFFLREVIAGTGGCFALAVARTLAEGLEAAGREKFHVVFLDLSLPDSRGLDTVRKAVSGMPDVPVVVLTGLEDAKAGVDSLRAGAQDYLIKGNISVDLIARSARYAIKRHRILRDLHEAQTHLEEKVRQRTAELAKTIDSLQSEVELRLAAEEDRRQAEVEVLRATEREQRRIGLDLHDGIQGTLTGIGMMLKALENAVARNDAQPEAMARQLKEIGELVRQTIRQTRGLSRGLSPVELAGSGLVRALELMAETTTSLFGVRCRFTAVGDVQMPEELVASQIYYIVQEASANALKHARCKDIDVTLCRVDGQVVITVEDNGVGMPAQARNASGMGLKTMSHRARLIGATLTIEPAAPRGTLIRLVVPEPATMPVQGKRD